MWRAWVLGLLWAGCTFQVEGKSESPRNDGRPPPADGGGDAAGAPLLTFEVAPTPSDVQIESNAIDWAHWGKNLDQHVTGRRTDGQLVRKLNPKTRLVINGAFGSFFYYDYDYGTQPSFSWYDGPQNASTGVPSEVFYDVTAGYPPLAITAPAEPSGATRTLLLYVSALAVSGQLTLSWSRSGQVLMPPPLLDKDMSGINSVYIIHYAHAGDELHVSWAPIVPMSPQPDTGIGAQAVILRGP